MTIKKITTIKNLPKCVFTLILIYLNNYELVRFRRTCKYFNDVFNYCQNYIPGKFFSLIMRNNLFDINKLYNAKYIKQKSKILKECSYDSIGEFAKTKVYTAEFKIYHYEIIIEYEKKYHIVKNIRFEVNDKFDYGKNIEKIYIEDFYVCRLEEVTGHNYHILQKIYGIKDNNIIPFSKKYYNLSGSIKIFIKRTNDKGKLPNIMVDFYKCKCNEKNNFNEYHNDKVEFLLQCQYNHLTGQIGNIKNKTKKMTTNFDHYGSIKYLILITKVKIKEIKIIFNDTKNIIINPKYCIRLGTNIAVPFVDCKYDDIIEISKQGVNINKDCVLEITYESENNYANISIFTIKANMVRYVNGSCGLMYYT